MGDLPNDLASVSYLLSGVGYAALAAYLLRLSPTSQGVGSVRHAVLAAVACSSFWAFLSAFERASAFSAPAFLASGFDLARYAFWLAVLLRLLRAPKPVLSLPSDGERPTFNWLAASAVSAVLAAAMALAIRMGRGDYEADASRLYVAASLTLPVLGLVLVEQLFRNLLDDSRWLAKPVCLALASTFAFDVYMYAEAVLLGRIDADAQSIRGAVHLIAVPLLFVAASRRADWVRTLQVSRRAAFYSATLLLAGGYLLFISAVGYYVRYSGGDWGRALQLGLLFAGVVVLAVLALSASVRARVRVFIGKHFFSYRYDYREEWLAFTAMLSARTAPSEVGIQVVRGLANMLECPAGSLWTRSGAEAPFSQAARWNAAEVRMLEPADSAMCQFLRQRGWIIDIDEHRSAPDLYADLPALPEWLNAAPEAWLVVPLLVGEELLGYVVLSRPRTTVELDWEVRDLLKTAGRQAAGFLAQMQATEALLEARKFDAFNRMSAFVVHDLKNIVTQLSLMLKNAERLHANPEFQQDMLLTVESSLEKMRRLMLQLREGATPPGGARGVEVTPIVRRLESLASAAGRVIKINLHDELATRGHEDRLERVLGHLVQNSLDATPATGQIEVTIKRFSGQVMVVVSDNGAGMTEDFLKNQLFRPFNTTKHSGMGIGTYESHQYIRELGGSIQVRSAVGAGTEVTVLLPLFDSHATSDLRTSGAA
jgi:putative PEP-CTERM system histidine kinase